MRSARKREIEKLNEEIRSCRKCHLSETRNKAVPGEGNIHTKIVFVGQAPGKDEDAQGSPFVGRAGRFLDELLDMIGIDRRDVYITSAIKCYPPRNRRPKREEVEACKPYLRRQLETIDPAIVVLLGGVALEVLLGEKGLAKVHGRIVRKGRRRFFVTYHPAAGMRFPEVRERMSEDFVRFQREQLRREDE